MKNSLRHQMDNSSASTSHDCQSRRHSDPIKRNSLQEKEKPLLLDWLGGMTALNSIVHEYCRRVIKDPELERFFEGVDPRIITAHQVLFFQMAFTKIDSHQKAELVIRSTHQRLFAIGLSEYHFDIFSRHVEETLRDRGFCSLIVQEALGVIAPLRIVFEEEAKRHCEQTGLVPCKHPCAV